MFALVNDPHNTATATVRSDTLAITRKRTDPFGNTRGATPAWPGDHQFLDKSLDTNGLTHVGAREYDSALGRFISVDPILVLTDPQQWNGYA